MTCSCHVGLLSQQLENAKVLKGLADRRMCVCTSLNTRHRLNKHPCVQYVRSDVKDSAVCVCVSDRAEDTSADMPLMISARICLLAH